MKIFFGCSTSQLREYKHNYIKIRDVIIENNHILTRDWLPLALAKLDSKDREYDAINAYKKVIEAINKSDLLIIDDTASGFSTGHEITLGLMKQKPTLVLWHNTKKRLFDKRMIHGIESPYLVTSYYEESNLEEIILKFINQFSHATQKHRFHLVIDEVERNYIDWAKFKNDKSRTEIIREAIREKLSNDGEYNKYLGKL